MRQLPLLLILTAAALTAAPPLSAQQKAAAQRKTGDQQKTAPRDQNDRPRSGRRSILTPGREAAALTFARLHHPELADLLPTLKTKNPRQYHLALRQLFQTSERLARIRGRDPERYETALTSWKLDSRIRLLAARMTMGTSSQLDQELRELVQQRADLRLRQLTDERRRLAERLQRLDELIDRINSNPEAATARQLQRIKRSIQGKGRAIQRTGQRRLPAGSQPVTAPDPRGDGKNPDKNKR